MTAQRGRRYYIGRRVPDTAMRLIDLPIAEMTLPELAEAVGMKPSTVADYLKMMRSEGLISAFAKRKNLSAEGCEAIRRHHIAANQAAIKAVKAELDDTRQDICPATWAVYAAVLTPDEMAANFKLRER